MTELPFSFSAHNICLDNGVFTKPEVDPIDQQPWFKSAKRLLDSIFPGDKSGIKLADIGTLEGGYAVELARMGFQVVGVDVREVNIEICEWVKSQVDLPNLSFILDNAVNISNHGNFDAIFCCGLLYHLDKPKEFLDILGKVTNKVLILQTHFSTEEDEPNTYSLSELTENEGLKGRWFVEFSDDESFADRGDRKFAWNSWDNRYSFWIQREYLLQAIKEAGFDLVMEQYDSLEPDIAQSIMSGWYRTHSRGTFIGIKA